MQIADRIQAIPHEYWHAQRWFGGKGRTIQSISIRDLAEIPLENGQGFLPLLDFAFEKEPTETYVVPMVVREGRLNQDGLEDPDLCLTILKCIRSKALVEGRQGRFFFRPTPEFDSIIGAIPPATTVKALLAMQSNTLIVFDQRGLLKCFRRVTPGINPDLEVTDFLTRHTHYRNVPRLAGVIEYLGAESRPWPLASLQAFVPNQGNAWTLWTDSLRDYYRRAVTNKPAREIAQKLIDWSWRLGVRTGQLHVALASNANLPDFAPQEVNKRNQDGWAAGLEHEVSSSMELLSARRADIPEDCLEAGHEVMSHSLQLATMAESLPKDSGWFLTRIHGDYHLGQVLASNDDFVIIDFEGEPLRASAIRRAKQSALKDVAGMLRSFNYAGFSALFEVEKADGIPRPVLEPHRIRWEEETRSAFLESYRAAVADSRVPLLPRSEEVFQRLLGVFELEKALYELRYELSHRPDWVAIPLSGIRQVLQAVRGEEG